MHDNIAGKVIVVTGASSGTGAATARHLAGLGAAVVLGARRTDRIEALARELRAAGCKASAVATDVTVADQVNGLVAAAVGEFGRIDVILNNAGLMPLAPLEQLKAGEWDQMIDVNLKGTLNGIAAALPHMIRQRSGQIINVSSVYGHKVGPNAAVYCATKFAVRALTEGLRQEVKPHNIRTTIISPGAVATELLEQISDKALKDEVAQRVASYALPADSFARMVAFAVNEPAEVDVSEILFRPTAQLT
jgi:NADP-dependent 3-hydroxy acid dehydrogenase YdfG